jgi:RHH-type proline utilization regulon transcriptional repressor/proline dehydrogenase/delta 1-pyrroline-5-carboxylate dehydrogenase
MLRRSPFTAAQTAVAEAINADYLADESECVRELLPRAGATPGLSGAIEDTARNLIARVRERRRESSSGMDAFLAHYDLSSQEGIVLMCLAEALLRIPDADTADRLIADKLSPANWQQHLGDSESWFVNASTWALMMTGRILRGDEAARSEPVATLNSLLVRLEEPLVRTALKAAMRLMAHEYVMGASIEDALDRAQHEENRHYRYSFDMLGEAALSSTDAERYQNAYQQAIEATARAAAGQPPGRMGISVKLSALSPRYEPLQGKRALAELGRRLRELSAIAAEADLLLTVDTEESERLALSLAVFQDVFEQLAAAPWQGLGLAVQAYQKRAPAVLAWLNALARKAGKRIPVRLVKGAYWDTEIKRSQERGLAGFPVYTRKRNTDVAYLACVRQMLAACSHLIPQFATHNAHTLSYVYHHAGERPYEFQRLHGMGEELYAEVVEPGKLARPCRVYAPVGAHADLLPYLVRRLLENGANTSFVNQIADPDVAIDDLVADPVAIVARRDKDMMHPRIRLPRELFRERRNSAGINFADEREVAQFLERVAGAATQQSTASPLVEGKICSGEPITIYNPAQPDEAVGRVEFAGSDVIERAISTAQRALPGWRNTDAERRAALLETAAQRLEDAAPDLIALCVREAGKTLLDAHDDVREAIDFLRYYAAECRRLFLAPRELPGPTGEQNRLYLEGRGVFLCISPWNFPAAIFTGQIAAALAAGNTVIAKPAEQSSLTAAALIALLHDAGVPGDVLGFLPARGAAVGESALGDERIAGVAFTGSVATAQAINRALAVRSGALPALIAETGGVNAMLVDSSALPEQVVIDVVRSAFNSAGQRCSALRVLYLQDTIAEHVLQPLVGYLAELVVGDPADPATDIGPVIDAAAQDALNAHIERFHGQVLYQAPLPAAAREGRFVPPTVIALDALAELPGEVFGPVLHVIRFRADALDAVVDEINASGYGLSFGIHSRIERRAEDLRRRIQAGNVYVNRNMIGAVVGVQPFGGRGLSGTGPKAGGPHYLERFATEKTYTVNTAAVGGNASLYAGD